MRRGPEGGKLVRVWGGDGGLAEASGWIEWGGLLVSHAKPYLCVAITVCYNCPIIAVRR